MGKPLTKKRSRKPPIVSLRPSAYPARHEQKPHLGVRASRPRSSASTTTSLRAGGRSATGSQRPLSLAKTPPERPIALPVLRRARFPRQHTLVTGLLKKRPTRRDCVVRYRSRLSRLVGWQRWATSQWFFNRPVTPLVQASPAQGTLPVFINE